MIKVLLRKLLLLIPTFIGVSFLAFILIRLVPGDPVMMMLGEKGVSKEIYAQMQANLGLDQPFYVQYFKYIGHVFQGDFGTSIVSNRPVLEEFWDRFPATLELGVVAMILAVVVGIPLGVIAALRRNTWLDYGLMGTSLVGYSMPIFWWGLILIMVFSVNLEWTPVAGRVNAMYEIQPITGFMLIDSLWSEEGLTAWFSALRHIALPAIALGTIPLAVIARMTRSSLLEVFSEDYIRSLRARGLQPWRVTLVHALRNAFIPVMVVIGLTFGSIITGAILTESIFSWPGIGKWLLHSVTSRDYPVIQGGVLLIAGLVVLVNFIVDVVNTMINPKLRDVRS